MELVLHVIKRKVYVGHCLSKGILSQQRIRHCNLTDFIFRLQSRHHQLLFKQKRRALFLFEKTRGPDTFQLTLLGMATYSLGNTDKNR